MGTKFNFKSQVCTSIEQSRKLLELGLKKKTADMCYSLDSVITQPFIPSDIFRCIVDTDTENKKTIPAWSLHRLFQIYTNGVISSSWNMAKFNWDDLIDCIEDSIVKGYFNKEYLEE